MSAQDDFGRSILAFMQDDPMTAYHIRHTAGSYDPATGEASTTVTETPVRAILLDITRLTNGLSTKFDTEIIAGDKELYCLPPERNDPLSPPLIIDPATDTIRVGINTYKIVTMKEANPNASVPLLYNLVIRR